MRLWSLHPRYLDPQGLGGLWREALLARSVLTNQTVGYKYHPQLIRFRQTDNPVAAINFYLAEIFKEATERDYNYSRDKVVFAQAAKIAVTTGQVFYELEHLFRKLVSRKATVNIRDFYQFSKRPATLLHPLFSLVEGDIEPWEVR